MRLGVLLPLLLYVGEGEETQWQHQRHSARDITRLVSARPVHYKIENICLGVTSQRTFVQM